MSTDTLTAAEVADDLHLSRNTVIAYLATRRIPGGWQPVEGGRWLVDAAQYRAWREQRMSRPSDPNRIPPRSDRSKAARSRKS